MADANLFSEYLKPVRSVADYSADLDKQEGNALELTAKRDSAADDVAVRKAYSAGGGDTNKIQQLLQQGGQYKAAQAMAKTQLENQKTQSEITKNTAQSDHFTQQSTASVADQKYKAALHHADGLAYVQTPDDVKTYISQGIAKGVFPSMTPEQIQAKLSQYGSVDAFKQAATQAAIPVLEQYKSAALDERGRLDRENRVLTTKMGNDTSIKTNAVTNETTRRGQNMTDNRAKEALQAGKNQVVQSDNGPVLVNTSSGSGKVINGPDGLPLPGVAKPLTEGQSKAVLFGSRMEKSHQIIEDLAKSGTATSNHGMTTGWGVGEVVGALSSSAQQQLTQAKRDFINADLRRESGASIAPSEFDNAEKQYFPQPGDKKEVIAQKANNRAIAIRGMQAEIPKAHSGLVKQVINGPDKTAGYEDAGKEARYQAWKAGQGK